MAGRVRLGLCDTTIALYSFFDQNPGVTKWSLVELCHRLFPMPKPLEKRWVLDELRSLKGKGWVDFSLVSGGSAGTVSLTDEGFRIAKDLTECEREARPCPASLDELAEIEPTLTGIVKRDSVLDQIRATLNFKTNHMIVLFGQPMVGKSKLLERVFKELANEGSLPLEC